MDEGLADWCLRWLGAEPEVVLFRAGYLSEVTGLRLADGRGVVLKARPPAPGWLAASRSRRPWPGPASACPRRPVTPTGSRRTSAGTTVARWRP